MRILLGRRQGRRDTVCRAEIVSKGWAEGERWRVRRWDRAWVQGENEGRRREARRRRLFGRCVARRIGGQTSSRCAESSGKRQSTSGKQQKEGQRKADTEGEGVREAEKVQGDRKGNKQRRQGGAGAQSPGAYGGASGRCAIGRIPELAFALSLPLSDGRAASGRARGNLRRGRAEPKTRGAKGGKVGAERHLDRVENARPRKTRDLTAHVKAFFFRQHVRLAPSSASCPVALPRRRRGRAGRRGMRPSSPFLTFHLTPSGPCA